MEEHASLWLGLFESALDFHANLLSDDPPYLCSHSLHMAGVMALKLNEMRGALSADGESA